MTDTNQKKSIETDFGQRVTVERVSGSSELIRIKNRELVGMGEALNANPQALEYIGSGAVHIYQSPILKQLIFVTQTPWGRASEDLATKALAALSGDSKVAFGRKRSTRRSGW